MNARDTRLPALEEIVKCPHCDVDCVWKASAGTWFLVLAEPTDSRYRAPFAGEMKYMHGEHQPHFCAEPPA